MSETGYSDTEDASSGIGGLIATLHAAGAPRFDPVRWHYLEVLTKRAATHEGSIKRMLDAKLAQALAAFKEQFDLARSENEEMLNQCMQDYPHAADELQRLFNAGDFKALRRLTANLKSGERITSLSSLVRRLEQASPQNTDARREQMTAPRAELKTIRKFRNTWSKLSVDKQVAQALEQAPKNAGPINSHMLVLRSLALMRDISPDYLNRFISYADTLLCLEPGEKERPEKPATPKKRQVTRSAKK